MDSAQGPERINVSELRRRIEDAGNLRNFLMKLHREGRKLHVEVRPEDLDSLPTSSNILYARYIIPIYLGHGGDMELYSPNPGGRSPQTKGLGYKNAKTARRSVQKVSGKSRKYQKQALGTMYYRAKHHTRRTRGMKNAMIVFKKRLVNLGMNTK
ncbi:hypothetical protein EB118_19020 [bacterium]|nr:hypothetical protein [Actinomycetota bacterium]NDG32154.1 hypothetical protein [bacterium]